MHVIPLFIACPKTRAAISLDVPSDVTSLARIWRMRKSVKCPHCGETHVVRVCDAYISTMTSDGYLRFLEVQEQFDDRAAAKADIPATTEVKRAAPTVTRSPRRSAP